MAQTTVPGTLGNIVWLVFGGLISSIVLFLLGGLVCLTIVGIPLGLQVFKLAKFVLLPFGKTVVNVNQTGFKMVLNIIWLLLFGWECALGHAVVGLIFCATVIGIPFGLQYFKIAQFVLLPLGHDFQ